MQKIATLRNLIGVILTLWLWPNSYAQVWSPDGSKIAFFYIHSIEDIYLVNPDGTGFEILDDHLDRDFAPVWSPDGKYILFTSIRDGNHELYRIKVRGKSVKKMTSSDYNSEGGDYSPDGRHIVFNSDRSGNDEIYVMDRKGKNIQRITNTEGLESTPKWSPDGRKILFRRAKDKDSHSNLFLMNPDGSEVQQITNDTNPHFHQSWSPDSDKFCYIKIVNRVFEIHIYNLTNHQDNVLVSKQGFQAFYPQWSPDSKWIAFTRDVAEGTKQDYPALFKVDMLGNEQLITNKNSFHLYNKMGN